MMRLKERMRRQRGQGMTEYIIVVAVIAILSMGVLYAFGDQLREVFFVTGSEMSGDDQDIEGQMGNKGDYTGKDIGDL
jgi:Flp pilus assembly pilin Flp